MDTATTALIAPAKLTLSLRVVGVRDDGYHLIDAEMTTLGVHDTLHVTEHSDRAATDRGSRLDFVGPYSDGIVADHTNLVARALRAVGRSADVVVDKSIPHGGGLGGGSADAAAILRWAGCSDLDVAASIGADVPFCVVGGRARVRGIGEIVEPIPERPGLVTLVIPPLVVGTPAVYRAYDESVAGARRAGRTEVEGASPNDLESAAIAVEPRLAEWRDRIERAAGVRPTLAGSGATWFLLGDHGTLSSELPGATVVVTTHR